MGISGFRESVIPASLRRLSDVDGGGWERSEETMFSDGREKVRRAPSCPYRLPSFLRLSEKDAHGLLRTEGEPSYRRMCKRIVSSSLSMSASSMVHRKFRQVDLQSLSRITIDELSGDVQFSLTSLRRMALVLA